MSLDQQCNYNLRLYGPLAACALSGPQGVTRGSIIFISQCIIKSFNNADNKTNGSLNNDDDNNNYLKDYLSNNNFVKNALGDANDDNVDSIECNKSKKQNILLKLCNPSGSFHRIIVNGKDISMAGVCRGSYPKLYKNADFLSDWAKSYPSIFLSRYY